MKKENPKLKAEKRTIFGRKVKKLRQQGIIPATLYGKGVESVSVQIKEAEVEKIWEKAGESGLVDLMLEKDSALPVLLRNPQYGVVSDDLIHIDCYKVNLDEKIVASVPIVLTGESFSVKNGNILVEVTNEVEVEALPMDLPEKFEVDLTALKTVEDVVTVGDLKTEDGVEIKNAADQVIVKTEEPKEEEVEEETVAPDEVPTTEQKEGDQPEADQPEAGKQGEGEKEEGGSEKGEKTGQPGADEAKKKG